MYMQMNEFKDLITPSLDDLERDPATMHRPSSHFPFYYSSLAHSLGHLIPSPIHSKLLWDVYSENVASLLPIFHCPTTRNLVWKASMNAEYLDPESEAKVFSIYFAAVTSSRPEECQTKFQTSQTAVSFCYRSTHWQEPTSSTLTAWACFKLLFYFCPASVALSWFGH